jgi:signal transduction histidine kinase
MTVVGLLCWLCVSVYVLARSGDRTAQELASASDQLQAQLEQDFRQRVIRGDFAPQATPLGGIASRVPDSLCLRYWSNTGGESEQGCGPSAAQPQLPRWLAAVLSSVGSGPGSVRRDISLWNRPVGTLEIAPLRGPLLERQWRSVREMLIVTAVTLLALEILVFWVISHAFRTTGAIVNALEQLGEGATSLRLQVARPREFARVAVSIHRLAQRLNDASIERMALTARLIGLQEKERQELAHELHEEFGQCVAALAALIASLRQGIAAGETLTEADVTPLQTLIEEMLAALRGLLQRMSAPPLEQQDLIAAIGELIIAWQGRLRGRPHIVFDAQAFGAAVPSDERALCAYRVVQECLGNIARHAGGCGTARVELRVGPDALQVRVSNDLLAATAAETRTGTGMGLKLLRERVLSLRGAFSVNASREEFAVEAALPLVSR